MKKTEKHPMSSLIPLFTGIILIAVALSFLLVNLSQNHLQTVEKKAIIAVENNEIEEIRTVTQKYAYDYRFGDELQYTERKYVLEITDENGGVSNLSVSWETFKNAEPLDTIVYYKGYRDEILPEAQQLLRVLKKTQELDGETQTVYYPIIQQ